MPLCSEVPQYMPQLPLAEELCIGALHAELEELKKPQSGIFQMGFTIRRLKLAWAELETGMAIRDLEFSDSVGSVSFATVPAGI